MRNQNSKVRTTKRKLSKCEGVCRTYSALQYAYADILEKDHSVVSFRCNVILTDFEEDGTYTTDFVITNDRGDMAVRECVLRDLMAKPKNVKLSLLQNRSKKDIISLRCGVIPLCRC